MLQWQILQSCARDSVRKLLFSGVTGILEHLNHNQPEHLSI